MSTKEPPFDQDFIDQQYELQVALAELSVEEIKARGAQARVHTDVNREQQIAETMRVHAALMRSATLMGTDERRPRGHRGRCTSDLRKRRGAVPQNSVSGTLSWRARCRIRPASENGGYRTCLPR